MPPALHARVGRNAIDWLRANPQHIEAFAGALSRLVADELSLLRLSHPLHDPQFPHMQRFFWFTPSHIAVFEWKHAERQLRVHTCRESPRRPRAA